MMSGRVIILGAGGFMGRAVWRALAEDPRCNHIAVHFRRPPEPAMLTHGADTWSALDLAEATPKAIIDVIEQSEADVVVNCAGATRGSLPELRSANVEITARVSAALTALGHVHLIHLGSAAEYGAHRTGQAITEHTPTRPVSDYGVTKLQGTRHLVAAGRARRLTATVLRVFNPLGRGSAPDTPLGRAAQEIHAAMRRGDDTITLRSLESWRDYIDARDVGGAVAAAVHTVPDGATVLNVGRGEAVHTPAISSRSWRRSRGSRGGSSNRTTACRGPHTSPGRPPTSARRRRRSAGRHVTASTHPSTNCGQVFGKESPYEPGCFDRSPISMSPGRVSGLTGPRRRANALLMRVYGPWAIRHVRQRRSYRWRGLTLTVPTGVFHPGLFFSSGVLATEIEQRKPVGLSVLDVGCGSGLLSLVASRVPARRSTAVDINPEAVRATAANAGANGLAVEALQSDLFASSAGRRFDLVVVNPPYFAKDPADDAERAWFAGADLGYFEQFFSGLGDHLVDRRASRPGADGAQRGLRHGRHRAPPPSATVSAWRSLHATRVWLGVQVVWTIDPRDPGA